MAHAPVAAVDAVATTNLLMRVQGVRSLHFADELNSLRLKPVQFRYVFHCSNSAVCSLPKLIIFGNKFHFNTAITLRN